MCSSPVFSDSNGFLVQMDASGIGIGEALSQRDLAKIEQFYALARNQILIPLSLGSLYLGYASMKYHLDHLDTQTNTPSWLHTKTDYCSGAILLQNWHLEQKPLRSVCATKQGKHVTAGSFDCQT